MTETAIVYGEQGDLGRYALAHCVNALAAGGAEEFSAKAMFQIPADQENTFLYWPVSPAHAARYSASVPSCSYL